MKDIVLILVVLVCVLFFQIKTLNDRINFIESMINIKE